MRSVPNPRSTRSIFTGWTPECLLNAALTLANGAGTVMLLTGVWTKVGVVLLGINATAQVVQIWQDIIAFLQGRLGRKHFMFNMFLNLADAAPGLGVLSGIYGLMGRCVFEWAWRWRGEE